MLDKDDRIPPKSAQRNAERGLELRKEWDRGGLSPEEAREQGIDSGVTRARQISAGKPLSEETISKMASFNRHRRNYKPDKKESDGGPTAGTIAWLLWGGTSGVDWAIKTSEKMDKGYKMKKIVVPFEMKEFDEGEEFFTFSGYASTFGNVDRGGDVVVKGAFAESIMALEGSSDHLPILWQHQHDQPVGIFTDIMEDGKGLFVKGRLPLADTFVRDRVIPQMKVGSIRKMSIGYNIAPGGATLVGGVKELRKLQLWEASLVTIPMNNEANVTEMKAVVPFQDLPLAERDRPWDSGQAVSRVREFTGSEDEPSSDYRKAFLWHDGEEEDLFGSYKLPIADVVNERLIAVPRAIFAAAAALRGARGGVDIPDEDRPGVIANVNRYYEKMGLESPFMEERSFRLDDFGSLTERDLEKALRSGVAFSAKMAKSFVSALKLGIFRDGKPGSRDGLSEAEEKALLKKLDEILMEK